MKKYFANLIRSERGSISAFEGIVLALFTVAIIVGVRLVLTSTSSKVKSKSETSANSVNLETPWPKLDPREPIKSFHPIKKK